MIADAIQGIVGNAYSIRIDFTVDPVGNPGNDNFRIDFDIGVAPAEINIIRRTNGFPAGSAATANSLTTGAFAGSTFETNGLRLYFESTIACDIYDIAFLIRCSYVAP